MENVLDFKDVNEFREWLKHNTINGNGVNLYIYKKGYEKKGITYEEAVRTALCFGWIDAVTHSHNDEKFIQYFAPRLKSSNWSISNKKRMRELINENLVTEEGLKYFELKWLETLDDEIEQDKIKKTKDVEIPDFFKEILIENDSIGLFMKENKSTQRRYIGYIMDAKKEETKIRRCSKVIRIIKGLEKNNL
jgi:uncharacterized protein YdeI (YjbR/CyaY-like superfamily)